MMATKWERHYGECPNGHKVVTDTAAKDGKNGADVLVYGEDGAEPTLVVFEPEDLPGMVAQEIVRGKRDCPNCSQGA